VKIRWTVRNGLDRETSAPEVCLIAAPTVLSTSARFNLFDERLIALHANVSALCKSDRSSSENRSENVSTSFPDVLTKVAL